MGWRAFVWSWVKKILFRLDAERAHRLTVALIAETHRFGGDPLLRLASGARGATTAPAVEIFGLPFASRVGLAAGFDKDAELVGALPALGFGFAEIGTVTPRPQPGNDKPRLFRDPATQAVFNRMGFNGGGAAVASRRLAAARSGLPAHFRVGVNVGKNKDTPLEIAARDYGDATAAFEGLADYLVINVSSPNTPGLRSLQTLEALAPIVESVNQAMRHWAKRPPLLLKLAPEVDADDLGRLLPRAEEWGVNGWVLTNTLGGTRETQVGGWSGAPLAEASRRSLVAARAATKLPIISVGGIMSGEEARTRIELGADLVQIYSGWIFRGPAFPCEIGEAIGSGD